VTKRVENFGLRAIPPGAMVENVKLDGAARPRVLDGVESSLKESYVYPQTAQKMDEDLRDRPKRSEYDAVTDGDAFAALLTKDLQEVSHDKHLRVDYSPYKLPTDDDHGPSPEEKEIERKQMERTNCGFVKAEILPGNIGYLKFNFFADAELCGPTAIAAMNFLSHVDAIIFDLRDNGGGDPKMIALISTYLFNKPTHLNDLYNRKEDETTQYWTLPYVPGNRLPDTPAFVLTSKMTFSGAEEFSYNLKILKRATIIGETTGGGAHPVSGHRIDDHFKGAQDWAGLRMRVDKESKQLAFDNMHERPIKGTTDWKNYDVVLDVPQEATGTFFGALLSGSGTIWLNGAKFEIVAPNVPTTGTAGAQKPDEPVNLDFGTS